MKYQCSCHCGTVTFEFESAPIESAMQCNCSVCRRKNALMSVNYTHQFTLLTGKEALSIYHWGDKVVNHYFCSKCGIYPFHNTKLRPKYFRINLGCVEGLDVSKLTIEFFDGKNQL